MNTDQPPGLARQSTVRTVARVAAVVLGAVGVILVVMGGREFLAGFDDPMADGGPGSILTVGAGGFCIVFALAAANVGWLRAQASYVAGETVPVIKQSLDHIRSGPFCSACGTRNDDTAKFCDSCGQSLA